MDWQLVYGVHIKLEKVCLKLYKDTHIYKLYHISEELLHHLLIQVHKKLLAYDMLEVINTVYTGATFWGGMCGEPAADVYMAASWSP